MSVCLLLIGDGRDELHERSVASAKLCLPPVEHLVKVDDRKHELGFAGAVEEGWRRVARTEAEWVFHLEADFVFNREVPLERMIAVLKAHSYLAQVALKRQPWNVAEREAGGIVELNPDDFSQRTEGGDIWTEHRRFFTTNPGVYSANLCRQGWPLEEHSEGRFTHRLLEDPKLRFALWGAKFDPPLVEHIGAERVGHGY